MALIISNINTTKKDYRTKKKKKYQKLDYLNK